MFRKLRYYIIITKKNMGSNRYNSICSSYYTNNKL